MKISATDSQGRPCSAEQDFILFSLSDVRLPVETTDWFYEDTSGWEEGKEAALYIGSSESDVRLFVNVYSSEKRIETQCIPLNRKSESSRIPGNPNTVTACRLYSLSCARDNYILIR